MGSNPIQAQRDIMAEHTSREQAVHNSGSDGDATRRQFLQHAGIVGASIALGTAPDRNADAQPNVAPVSETVIAPQDAHSAPAVPVASDPGPSNPAFVAQSPHTCLPPRTDHGEVFSFWHSFSLMHRRI